MDQETLSQYMMTAAKHDVFDGQARILIPDFLQSLPLNPKPTIQEILQAWRKYQPSHPITQKMNVLIISFAPRTSLSTNFDIFENEEYHPFSEEV